MSGQESQRQSSKFEFWGDLEPATRDSEAPNYLGVWELVPEISLYEHGPVPAWCNYEIGGKDSRLQVVIAWQMVTDGPRSVTEFSGPVDGTLQKISGSPPGAPTEFSLTHVDTRTLDSAAFLSGKRVAYARRVVSSDGSLLAIVQEGSRPDGAKFRNFQVYRRVTVEPPV